METQKKHKKNYKKRPKLIEIYGKDYIEAKTANLPYGWLQHVQYLTGKSESTIRKTRHGLTGNFKIWKLIESISRGERLDVIELDKSENVFLRNFKKQKVVKLYIKYYGIKRLYGHNFDFDQFFSFVSRNPKLEGNKITLSSEGNKEQELLILKRENEIFRHKLELLGML